MQVLLQLGHGELDASIVRLVPRIFVGSKRDIQTETPPHLPYGVERILDALGWGLVSTSRFLAQRMNYFSHPGDPARLQK
jgi:hypothetical protein